MLHKNYLWFITLCQIMKMHPKIKIFFTSLVHIQILNAFVVKYLLLLMMIHSVSILKKHNPIKIHSRLIQLVLAHKDESLYGKIISSFKSLMVYHVNCLFWLNSYVFMPNPMTFPVQSMGWLLIAHPWQANIQYSSPSFECSSSLQKLGFMKTFPASSFMVADNEVVMIHDE